MSSLNASKRYFCHQCDRTVTIPTPIPSELSCPTCHGGFLEEFDVPSPNPNPNPFLEPFFPFPFHAASNAGGPTDPFNPFQFLQTYLNAMMGGDGSNVQIVFEGDTEGIPRMGTNFGDYFIGPGLEQLIQQLAENDPNRYGTPPAAKEAVDRLPDIKISEDLKRKDDGEQCAVCKDEFEVGSLAKQLPCKHLYHKECIVPWLEMHNSCPVCRFELPTDDADYESGRRGGGGDGNGRERRFRIQLPWSLRAAGGAQGEGSNAGGGGNGGSGGEPRQENLD